MKKPISIFKNTKPKALVTWAFDIPEWFSQKKFFQKFGFIQALGDDPLLLFYPLTSGYVYERTQNYNPQKEDDNKVLIFRDSSCPFSISFQNQIMKLIREISQDIPITIIDKFENPMEYNKRGKVPSCAVNKIPITTFFMDKENFIKEVKEALVS